MDSKLQIMFFFLLIGRQILHSQLHLLLHGAVAPVLRCSAYFNSPVAVYAPAVQSSQKVKIIMKHMNLKLNSLIIL